MISPIPIFCAAASQDRRWLAEWEFHLKLLQRTGDITIWSEAHILPGRSRDTTIAHYLGNAKIVVLLLSPAFFTDHKCLAVLTQALNYAQSGQTRIIPLLLRATTWEETALGGLVCLPTNGNPVENWRNRDDAFYNCAQSLRKLLAELQSSDNN